MTHKRNFPRKRANWESKKARRNRFNQELMRILREDEPGAANMLGSRGIALGWWSSVDYHRLNGHRARMAADTIIRLYHREATE